jgi:hypothetical protein
VGQTILEVRGLSMFFPGNKALEGADLSLRFAGVEREFRDPTVAENIFSGHLLKGRSGLLITRLGIPATVLTSRIGSTRPNIASGWELDVIVTGVLLAMAIIPPRAVETLRRRALLRREAA